MKIQLRIWLLALLWVSISFSNSVWAQADIEIEKLENLLKLTKNDTSRVNILNRLAEKYLKETPTKARRFAEEALDIAEQLRYRVGIRNSTDNLGMIYQTQGAYAKAIEFYNKSLVIKESEKDRNGVADSYNKLGSTYIFVEDIDRAIDYYKQALKIREQTGDLKGMTGTLTNLGSAFYKKNEYSESISYHQEALNLADSLSDKTLIAYNLNRLGETFFRMKDYRESMRCYQQLLHLGQRIDNKAEIQRAYLGMSQLAAAQDDFRKAYQYYQFYSDTKEGILRQQQASSKEAQELAEKGLELERQQKELIKEQNARQTIINYLFLVVLASILIVTYIIFRNFRQQQKVNSILEQQKKEIELKSNALEEQKNKIEIQNDSINRKNETLEATFKEIERKNKDITASINYAKRIQESMLPRNSRIFESLPDHFVLFRPRDIVSGDFYWYAHRDGKTILAALDCTGHGVPGAFMTMLGDSYLNQIIKLQGITEPDEILDELHNSIGIALNQEVTKNQDGMDVALCVIDHTKKIMEFAGASRPLLIVQDGQAQSIESSKLPVGGFQKDRERIFTKHTFDISKPTVFYIFSDGYQDQFGGARGRKFSKNRLEEALVEHHHLPMVEQKRALNTTLIDWMGENRQMDDILVIGVRV
ncbi:MAG: tetratricopeptide repeat protein [Microscillaceae bacterium]|jgi:serine phosphatase RsbU (regulator of sigma subunit)|nr:tetratricopeptide repeat protein [Microscillaceae bacterium]